MRPLRGRAIAALAAATALLLAACGDEPPPDPPGNEDLVVTSTVFEAGEAIPAQYTCEGEEVSPPLVWAGEPDGTAGFAVVMSDPDAPGGDFIHWVLYDIPATESSLDEGVGEVVGQVGETSAGEAAYVGPCPPEGDEPHRYRFTVYALSRLLGIEAGSAYEDVRAELDEAAIASGTLEAEFSR